MTNVSKHAERRIRKRLGIPKSSVEANFEKALLHGKRQADFKGAFKRYLAFWAIRYKSTPIVYANTIFFVVDSILVTAWPVPQKYKTYIKEVSC